MSLWKPAEQLLDKGFEFLESQDYEAAVRIGKRLKRKRHPSAFEILATAYAEGGDLPGAIRELEAGVETAPDAWRLWQLLGNYYSDEKRYEDAKQAFGRAISYPDSWVDSVRLNLAIAMSRGGEHDRALQTLDQISDDTLRIFVAASTVSALNHLARYEAAIERAESAISRPASDPQDEEPLSRLHSGLGRAAWELRKDAGVALKHSWRAIELNPCNHNALFLVREVRNQRTPDSKYFRLLVHGEWHEPVDNVAETQGFYRSFDVVADTQEAALEFAKEFEPETTHPSITIDSCEIIGPAPDSPHGVYVAVGHVYYSETEED